jgi:hypothetical protein
MEMRTKLLPAALIAAMMATPAAHAAEIEGYQMFLCHTEPYPVGETCEGTAAVRADRQPCEDDAARVNGRVAHNSVLRAECRSIIVDCSRQNSIICSIARDRAQADDWNKAVAGRIAKGAKQEKKCYGGYCATATISPGDGLIYQYQMLETTGSVNSRLECTVEMDDYWGTKGYVRICGTFVPSHHWRAEVIDRAGSWSVVKEGTIDEVYESMGWPTH